MTENSTALSDNQYKLIVEPAGIQLYDLKDDPGEKNNLSRVKPEITAKMSTVLNAWTSSVRKSVAARLQAAVLTDAERMEQEPEEHTPPK
jgi:hypothetical protein